MSKQREEFERVVKEKYPDANLSRLGEHGRYLVHNAEYMWEAWQASRAAALESAAVQAETVLCDCGWGEREIEASQVIAFQIRALKEQS